MNSILATALILLFGIFQVVIAEECIDARSKQKEIAACCNIRNPVDMSLAKDCAKEFESEPDSTMMLMCTYECIGNKTGTIVVDTINKDKLLEVASTIEDDEGKKLVKSAIEVCVEQTPQAVKDVKEDDTPKRCSSFPLLFDECIMRHIFAECPDSHWQKAEICDKIKGGVPVCQ